MTVTQIEQIKNGRGRVRLTLADASAFLLYPAERKDLGIQDLREGDDLPEEALRRIREELLPLRAKKRAMHLLEKRPYTERRLREKLAEGEYPEEALEAALAYVRSYGYLNDLQYAKDYIAYRLQSANRAKLTAALMQRGVDRHLIEEAFAAVYEDCAGMHDLAAPTVPGSAMDNRTGGASGEATAVDRDSDPARATELALLEKELRKKRFDPETFTYEEKMRLTASLARKGFDPALIREAMKTE